MRYKSCRYLVVYQILKVSNISLNHCGRDAMGKLDVWSPARLMKTADLAVESSLNQTSKLVNKK